MARSISTKDATAFKSALDFYEAKNYKNALVEVDKILKRRADFGDALCLKALTLYHLNRKDEAGPLVLEGTKASENSAVAWHMAGIYYKLEKNYAEAFKAYLKSYRIDSENVSVHQDLSMLSMHERQYAVLVEVRRRMLGERPTLHMVWLNMAIAQYMSADPSGAVKTLELFGQLLGNESNRPKGMRTPTQEIAGDIEASEVAMFKNRCIEATGDLEAALADLEKIKAKVLDKVALAEKRAAFLLKLGRPDATAAYRDLIKRNPNNASYYDALEQSLGLKTVAERAAVHRALAKRYPRAELPQLRPLTFLEGSELAVHLQAYIEAKLARGVPSCFEFVKDVYRSHPDIARQVGDAIAAQDPPADAELQAIRALFVARHLSYTNRHAEALVVIEAAPETAETALAHAKVLARQGDFATAAQLLEKAAAADPGDRFLNAKAAKYALKANDVEKGVEIASIFPIAGLHTLDGIKHLTEMESVNYLAPLAAAYSRVADHGMALKRAEGVASVFDAYNIDQYDFHFYGARRGNLRAYVDLLEWEDSLFAHPRYLEAVQVAVGEYVALARGEDDGVDAETKAKLKTKRAKLLKRLEEEPPFTPKGLDKPEERDTDPFGREFLDKRAPLDEALRLWKPLQAARPTDAKTWQLVFDIYIAQHKYVLAVQALKRAKELAAPASWVAAAAARARFELENDTKAPEVIRGLQLKILPTVVPDVMAGDLAAFVDKHVTDVLDWAAARHFVGATDGIEARLAAEAVADLDTCAQATLLLRKWRLDTGKFAAAARAKWPRASFI